MRESVLRLARTRRAQSAQLSTLYDKETHVLVQRAWNMFLSEGRDLLLHLRESGFWNNSLYVPKTDKWNFGQKKNLALKTKQKHVVILLINADTWLARFHRVWNHIISVEFMCLCVIWYRNTQLDEAEVGQKSSIWELILKTDLAWSGGSEEAVQRISKAKNTSKKRTWTAVSTGGKKPHTHQIPKRVNLSKTISGVTTTTTSTHQTNKLQCSTVQSTE